MKCASTATKKRQYSVKSGYRIALTIKFPKASCCSITDSSYWKIIWNLNVPEKIKMIYFILFFLWRAVKNISLLLKIFGEGRYYKPPCAKYAEEVWKTYHMPFFTVRQLVKSGGFLFFFFLFFFQNKMG